MIKCYLFGFRASERASESSKRAHCEKFLTVGVSLALTS